MLASRLCRTLWIAIVALGASGEARAGPPAPVAPRIAAADGDWLELPPPRGRRGHTAIFDAAHDRMVVFGGTAFQVTLNETWQLAFAGDPEWSAITPASGPSARDGHTAIADPARSRMIVFGGGASLADLWALDLGGVPSWSALTSTGTPPTGRTGHTAIYDPVRDRMIVFGGSSGGVRLSDVWALDLASLAWTPLAPSGTAPSARRGHAAIYDPVRDRMIVFGGSSSMGRLNDAWVLDLASLAWSPLAPAGGSPPVREDAAAAYDAARDRMIILGGTGAITLGDAWALDLAAPSWSPLAPAGATPPPRADHTAVLDATRDRLVVFGGSTATGANDVWTLDLAGATTWSAIVPAGGIPPIRDGIAPVVDSFRHRMIVYGGGAAYTDVWQLTLDRDPRWTMLAPTGTAPPGRAYHVAIHDAPRDRMVVFGGTSSGGQRLNDVWALDLASHAWSPITALGTPPAARANHAAIYDPLRDRMIVFGGVTTNMLLNDVWSLSLSTPATWTTIVPGGTPPAPRSYPSTIYDPGGDRMLMFGGTGRNDVWSLNLSGPPAWTPIVPSGTPPHGRFGQSAHYDPYRARMIVYGGAYPGFPSYQYFGDTWQLDLTGPPSWTELAPSGPRPPPRLNHGAVYDPVFDRMVVFAGEGENTVFYDDTWMLVWKTPSLGVAERSSGAIRLAAPVPSPARGAARIRFELARAGRATLSVLDLEGRRVATIRDGWATAGAHECVWSGRDEAGRAASAGVYLVRLEADGARLARKLVWLR